jgi:RES domain-containing protein
MIVYRINDCRYIRDLSGTGSALYGGRWNSKDTYVLYTAQSGALALLEAVVHFGKIPENGYCMVSISVPDDIESFPIERLPNGWQDHPSPDFLKTIGDYFIKSGRHLALKMPSVVMPEEHNYLINPVHPDFNKVKIVSQKPIKMDERLFSA